MYFIGKEYPKTKQNKTSHDVLQKFMQELPIVRMINCKTQNWYTIESIAWLYLLLSIIDIDIYKHLFLNVHFIIILLTSSKVVLKLSL